MLQNPTEREFAFEEYRNLRAEISKKMDNQYKVLNLGIGGITVLFGLALKFGISEFFLILPLLIVANHYLYLAECRAIINAGEYIKKLETEIYSDPELGWERFVSRKVYKPFDFIALMIFLGLFVISFIKGVTFLMQDVDFPANVWKYLALFFYCLLLFGFYVFVVRYQFLKRKLWKK